MSNYRLSIGDSTRGFDGADIVKTGDDKYKLIATSIYGRLSIIRKAVAAANRGDTGVVFPSGDVIPFSIRKI